MFSVLLEYCIIIILYQSNQKIQYIEQMDQKTYGVRNY